MKNNSNYNLDEIKEAIIDLYQNVKIRKQSETISIDDSYLKKEKLSLENVSPLTLISYIKNHIELLIDVKVTEKLSLMNTDPSLLFSEYGSDITPTNYENLLRRYESDIRNYIKIENMLKIHIDELYYKIEQLEKTIELLRQKIPDKDNNNIESYKNKIEELSNLIKLYEKSNLKIPLLEKKIRIQKLELDKLNQYRTQYNSYSKKKDKLQRQTSLKTLRNPKSIYSNYKKLKSNNSSRSKKNESIINSITNNNNENSFLTTNIHSPSFATMTQRTMCNYDSNDDDNDKSTYYISTRKKNTSPISLTKKIKCISSAKRCCTTRQFTKNKNNNTKTKIPNKIIPKSPSIFTLKDKFNKTISKKKKTISRYNSNTQEKKNIINEMNKTISDIDKIPFVNYINIYSNINSNNNNCENNNIPKKENNRCIRAFLMNKTNNLSQLQRKSIPSKRENSQTKSFLEN